MTNNQYPYASPDRPRNYRPSLHSRHHLEHGNHPLIEMLPIAVPIEIAKLLQRGGPNDTDVDLVRMYGFNSLDGADAALFGGGAKGEAATWFNCLAQSIAVMAFVPGGCTILGVRYEAQVTERVTP